MQVEPAQSTHYQKIQAEIQEKEKEKKAINAKITRAKTKNDGRYPPFVAALSKESHQKLVDIIQLQDKLVNYSL